MHFVGSNSQVGYIAISYKIYMQIFQAGRFFTTKQIAMAFNKTHNHVFILPSKTCQHHLETRAAHV